MCQGFSNFSAFLHHFALPNIFQNISVLYRHHQYFQDFFLLLIRTNGLKHWVISLCLEILEFFYNSYNG